MSGVSLRDLALRDARSTDAGAVGAILSALIDGTPWMPRLYSRAQDISFAGNMIDHGWVRVAEAQTGVVGFLARDGAEVNALYVAPEARGQGVGSALLTEAQSLSPALELFTFQANAGAQRFYARHGFSETARSDGAENDEGLPDIRLEWRAPEQPAKGAEA